MPNHLSNLDPPVVSAALDIHIAYMAKEELYRNWFFRWLILSLGAFSVNRKKIEKGTIKTAKEVISKGWCLGVFLEGTRSKTPGILGMPNLGPAYFANLVDVPILPVGITCSNKMFGPIAVKIAKLFYPDEDLEKAKWQCAEKLAGLTGFKLPNKTRTEN